MIINIEGSIIPSVVGTSYRYSWKAKAAMTTMEGKLQQVKSLLSSSSVNNLRVIDFQLTIKIRSSVVLTSKAYKLYVYEQFLAKKLHRNFLSESFFPSKIAEYDE